ncbi:MAG: ATP-binding protein [Candidatus Aenigmatarchaeota archaeon]
MGEFKGTVFDTRSITKIRFSTKPGESISSGSLIEVRGSDNKKYLGRVTSIQRKSYLIDRDSAVQLSSLFSENEKLRLDDIGITHEFEDFLICEAEIIGRRRENSNFFERPKRPFKIGTKVFEASQEFLNEQLEPQNKKSIKIGSFRDNEDVLINIDLNELISKHFSVLAMTGSGKSWTISVIIESIASEYDIPILIFDPHGEYSSLKVPRKEEGEIISKKTKVFVAADEYTKQLSDEMFKNKFGKERESEALYFNITDLETYQVIHLLKSLYDLSEAQTRIIQAGWTDVVNDPELKDTPNIDRITEKLDDVAKDVTQGISAQRILKTKLQMLYDTLPYIRKVTNQKIIKEEELVKKGQISVIDISGIEAVQQQALVAVLSSRILHKRMEGKIPPLLLILEEAHRYIPSGTVNTASKPTIKRVAQEGRKFLMGLGIVSQRPSRVDDDVLSQCNTQIIMRLTNPTDQNYVKKVSEWVSESDLEEIKTMNPGEAFVFGSAVPISLPVKIKEKRLTKHGGYTPDIIDELENFQ